MTKEDFIKAIVKGISSFKIIPFFGAGMSKPCGAMDWGEIIASLNTELFSSETNALIVAQEYEDKFGRKMLISRLQAFCKLSKVNSDTLKNHLLLLGMNPPLVYTTNYDNALEEAAHLLNRDYKEIVSLKDIRDAAHGQRQIIKFHGDFSDASSIVFTRGDYDRRLHVEINPLDVQFRSNILGKSVLFLGYGFGDENIDLIFNLHKERYGKENIPQSYIISFQQNDEKELVLKNKNVVTLHLSGPDELADLIGIISEQVFQKTARSQFEDIFKPLPSLALTITDMAHLDRYVDAEEFTNQAKQAKIHASLEGRTLASDVGVAYATWVKKIIEGDYSSEIREAMLLSFQFIHGLERVQMISICFDLMYLTDDPHLLLDLEGQNWGTDVVMVIEQKLGGIIKSSVEIRKWVCLLILSYLASMIVEKKKLPPTQVERLLDALKTQRYNELELGDLGCDFTPDNITKTIDTYLTQNPTMSYRFKLKPMFKLNTVNELQEQFLKSLPKALQ
jgi:hypothetical protein